MVGQRPKTEEKEQDSHQTQARRLEDKEVQNRNHLLEEDGMVSSIWEKRRKEEHHQKEILEVEVETEAHQEADHQVEVTLDHGVDKETALGEDLEQWC